MTEILAHQSGIRIEVRYADFWLNGPKEGLQIGNHVVSQLNSHDVKIRRVQVWYRTDYQIGEFALGNLRHLIECNTVPRAEIRIGNLSEIILSSREVDRLLDAFVKLCRLKPSSSKDLDMMQAMARLITELEATSSSWKEPPPYSA